MSVAVKLATNYEKISRRGTATILISKHFFQHTIFHHYNLNLRTCTLIFIIIFSLMFGMLVSFAVLCVTAQQKDNNFGYFTFIMRESQLDLARII
jgi:hypothetical protein